MKPLILDLCGGTGAWSDPWKDAGYDVRVVTLPDYDVMTYIPPKGVYGVLAAPPCTQFSIARQDSTAKIPRDFMKGMKTVEACLRIIWSCMADGAQFWALENPGSGYLRYFLGKPTLMFEPYEFGDNYSKKTALWGHFSKPERTPLALTFGVKVAAGKGWENMSHSIIPSGYKMPPDMTPRQVRRSMTPPGFAQAFYKANKENIQ